MRITIDTDLQCVIVPNSYYEQIDKLNEVIEAAGGNKLDYTQYIKDCFRNCFETKIIRQSDVSKQKPRKAKRSSSAEKETAPEQAEVKKEAPKAGDAK